MIDVSTKKPLSISTDGMSARVGPHIWLPLSQVKDVQKLLDGHGIRYRTEANALSMNGGPYMVFMFLPPGTDAPAIQTILDEIN